MKQFKTVQGTIVNVVEHSLEIIINQPNIQVHIGTDSQNEGDSTVYVTVIAYRYNHNGVHYIYTKQRVPRINDLWTRLWKEAELTIEVADWFTQKINLPVQLDMDFNEERFSQTNQLNKSHQLVQAASGWAQSLGYKVNCKPFALIASRAADYHCR